MLSGGLLVREKKKENQKKNFFLLNRGLEPLLSPSPAQRLVIVPVEPPRLVSKLQALIAGYIL